MKLETFSFTGDHGVVVYTELERPGAVTGVDAVAGGLLAGDREMVDQVKAVLDGGSENAVCVVQPNVYYRFTPGRDALADVAAAMLLVGAGRGELSGRGAEILLAELGDTVMPDASGGSPVY